MELSDTNNTGQRPYEGYVKSSFSDGGGQCVLVRRYEGEQRVFIRDSKYQRNPRNRPEEEPIVEMPASAWDAFQGLVLGQATTTVVAGHPEIEHATDGGVVLRGVNGTTVEFTQGEWVAFRAGVAAGEFGARPAAAA